MARDRFVRFPSAVMTDDTLHPTARLVYAAIVDCVFQRRTPTATWIGAQVGVSRFQVFRHLAALEAAGAIRVFRSAGRPNRYEVVEKMSSSGAGATGCMDATSSAHATGTSSAHATGTSSAGATGLALPPYKGFKNCEEGNKEADPPPPSEARAPDRTPMLTGFAEHLDRTLRTGLDYRLGDHPGDPRSQALRPWGPRLVAEFFVRQSWHRPTDVENAFLYVRELAAIDATEAEAAEALAWVDANPIRGQFSRTDLRRRVIGRIRDRRRLAAAAATRSSAAPEVSEAERAKAADLLRAHLGGEK